MRQYTVVASGCRGRWDVAASAKFFTNRAVLYAARTALQPAVQLQSRNRPGTGPRHVLNANLPLVGEQQRFPLPGADY